MSWDPPSDGPSPDAEAADEAFESDLAELVSERGAVLLDALETHYPGSRDHANATASYAFGAAVELRFEREHAEAVRETARLHEVGMLYVPAAVLAARPEDRDAEAQALIDAHPGYGADLARGAGVPPRACKWIEATAERFDGRGPSGLAGERVPLEARIIRVACACDRMLTAPHPHPQASAAEHRATAFATLRATGGRELDPRVVAALTGMLERVSRGASPA
jgi:HD-GYP domain-containing protein (c-di-GMP phosphodiesterase class II)